MDAMKGLSEQWEARWPGSRPLAHELRDAFHSNWVRFHSLPDSKRYPETPQENESVLLRHNTLLEGLVRLSLDDAPSILVITCAWGGPRDRHRAPPLESIDPQATYWRSDMHESPDDIYPDGAWTHLWVSSKLWATGCIDPLLALVAKDATAGLIIAPPSLSWLYHPYDGGADVIAPSPDHRRTLADRYREWLSPRPHGL